MSTISDDQLFQYADRVRDRVVIITGAANGIGKETALRFGAHGYSIFMFSICITQYGSAKVVIGDLDVTGAEKVVEEIEQAGGHVCWVLSCYLYLKWSYRKAIYKKCNVTVWDEQVALFEQAISTYGSVDVVIPNAGVGQEAPLSAPILKDGKPVKPILTTLDVNLNGVIYSTYLAQHYLTLNRKANQLKALVLIGSMASWVGLPQGELYAASKHAILGLMRSLHGHFALQNIRIACIHPFFADTAIVPVAAKVFLAGIPLATVPRISGAIFYSATNPDHETSGNAWLIPDNGPVFMVPKEKFKLGVYKMIDERVNAALKIASGVEYYASIARDLIRILGKPLLVLGLALIAAGFGWSYGHR